MLEAELWAIYHDLSIALKKGALKVVVESDSELTIKLLSNGSDTGHPLYDLVRGVINIEENTMEIVWRKIARKANSMADLLAKESLSMVELCRIYDSLPNSCISFFNADLSGLGPELALL